MNALNIGQLAKASETGIETIRFYERHGLMPAPTRAASGYHRYPRAAAKRMHFIQRAKRLGFTLNETASLLRLEEGGNRTETKTIASTKLEEIESRIADLQRMRKRLRELTQHCSDQGSGSRAGYPITAALNDRDAQMSEQTRAGATDPVCGISGGSPSRLEECDSLAVIRLISAIIFYVRK